MPAVRAHGIYVQGAADSFDLALMLHYGTIVCSRCRSLFWEFYLPFKPLLCFVIKVIDVSNILHQGSVYKKQYTPVIKFSILVQKCLY